MKLWLTVEYKNNDAVLKIVFDLKNLSSYSSASGAVSM